MYYLVFYSYIACLLLMYYIQGIFVQPSRMNRSTHDILAEIFKKIGSKENTREVCYSSVSFIKLLSICIAYNVNLTK